MSKLVRVLEKGRELISQGFTHGASARNINGRDIDPWDSAAVCFCSVGAVERAAKDVRAFTEVTNARNMLGKSIKLQEHHMGAVGIVRFNDNSTKEQVVKMWDDAIQLAKEEDK